MDPAKLKVVELRAELAARGLDQKGVKAILVSRLQAALDQEQQNLTAVNTTDVDSSVHEEDSSITENQFLPQEQFQVQTEPPVLPDTSTQSSDASSVDEPQYETRIGDEPSLPQQYYQQDTEAEFLNQNQQTQQQSPPPLQQQQDSEEEEEEDGADDDDDDEEQSQSSQSDSNVEENNHEQNDEVSSEPVEHQKFADTEEPMETEQTESTDAFATEHFVEISANHEQQNEPSVETEAIREAVLSETNEGELMAAENTDKEEESAKNGNDKEVEEEKGDENQAKKNSTTSDKDASEKSGESRKRKRSRSKSKSPPAKRINRRTSPARNTDDFTNEEDEPEFDENAVLLSWYDSDLNLVINKPDLCSARPLSDGVLALAWAGARSTYGVDKGKVCYEVQVNDINRLPSLNDERNLYELRCGWSILSDNLQLGESNLSFGYSGCAKKASNSVFSEYGIKFGSRGDVVGVYLDLDSTPCTISYTVNGEEQGTAFEFNKEDLNGAALFPHILTKNLAFTVNFGQCSKLLVNEERPIRSRRDDGSRRDKDKRSKDSATKTSSSGEVDDKKKSTTERESHKMYDKDEEKLVETKESKELKETQNESAAEVESVKEKTAVSENGDNNDDKNGDKDKPNEALTQQKEYSLLPEYELIGKIGIENLVRGYQRPKTRKECEVILLIGLPGAGKTYWANKHSKENVEKHYNILGVQNLLSKMTVCGESRKKHHSHGRWERFIEWATRGLHSIQDIAVKKRRNYILDQANVLASAQRRKMKGYGDFKRIAAIIVPDDTTYNERCEKQEDKQFADISIYEMKANFTLPSADFGWFDEVIYTELNEEDSKKKVKEMNEIGKKELKERERDRGNERGDRRRDDNRDRYGRDRRNWGQSSDRRWQHQRSSSSHQWHNRGISSSNSGRSRDKWHGNSSSSGGSSWGNRRYDYQNHRDRRHDDRRGGSRSDRDYKDSRDKRSSGDKHGSKRDKDNHSSSRSSYSSKGSSWNSNKSYNRSQTMSSNSRDYGSYSSISSSQQSSASSNWASATSNYTPQQQQWLQWQQQGPLMQATQHQSQAQHQQANNTQWWQQQQQQQQQASSNHQGWQNWAQYAQAYGVNASNSNGANMAKK